MSYGAGAGSHPTASAVVGDIIEIGRHLTLSGGELEPPLSVPFKNLSKEEMLPMDQIDSQYCLRVPMDQPAQYQQEFEKHLLTLGISPVKSVQLAKVAGFEGGVLGVITNMVNEAAMQKSLKDLSTLPFVTDSIKLIRVESN